MGTTPRDIAAPSRARIAPLYAAGFTTAFGAHAVAASLGSQSEGAVRSLLALGALLAVYDGAEVVLKPVFGSLADRIGLRPVLLVGLVVFALASMLYVLGDEPVWLWFARFGQGVGASAFSPAASALVSRLNPAARQGRAFGSYGSFKSVGYLAGPLLGGVVVWFGGLRLLFTVLAVLAVCVAVWVRVAVPAVAPLPRSRQTLLGLARRLTEPGFVRPTAALAGATAAMSVGVGFLPVVGRAAGYGPVLTGACVSLLALAAAVVQPRAGRWLDSGRVTPRGGMASGTLLTAAGLVLVLVPGLAGVALSAVLVGVGTGLVTPVAFASLAGGSPRERLGQTMGAAELGRELGDAGGPLLVAGVAAATSVGAGFVALAAVLAAPVAWSSRRR